LKKKEERMAYLMIVDDDEDFTSAAATVLKNEGHEVGIESKCDEALKHMESRIPDLAILDVMFPEDAGAGFDLARKIRKKGKDLEKMPILLLTGVNTRFPLGFGPSDIDDAWMPVTDYLEKPINFDVLISRVAALLSKGKG
jgi:DNA-binding response OmpR family regulator